MNQTKGDMLVNGLEQIREGLETIAQLDSGPELVRMLVGSRAGAERLRDVVKSDRILYNMIVSMVAARNGKKLVYETVEKVVNDFLDVLFDLSRPYKELPTGNEDDENRSD